MTAVPVSAASSETRYVVPSEVQNTYTKGAYQVSIESSTRTLYYESRGGIADGVSWAFGPLCFVSRVNRSIILLSGEPAIFYAMADVFRFGRVTSLILSDSGEVQEKYTFTRDPERNLVTKVEEETPSASVTYNISYDRSSTIHSIARERRGRPLVVLAYVVISPHCPGAQGAARRTGCLPSQRRKCGLRLQTAKRKDGELQGGDQQQRAPAVLRRGPL